MRSPRLLGHPVRPRSFETKKSPCFKLNIVRLEWVVHYSRRAADHAVKLKAFRVDLGCSVAAPCPSGRGDPAQYPQYGMWAVRCMHHGFPLLLRLRFLPHLVPTRQRQTRNRHTTSLYNGVCWNSSAHKFQAGVTFKRQNLHIGYFECEIEAAKAFDDRLRELCHDKMRLRRSLNFPTPLEASFRETPQQARDRTVAIHSDKATKEEESFRRLQQHFLLSPQAKDFEIVRVSGSSRIDAIFQPRSSSQGGLCLQVKASSPYGPKSRTYKFQHTAGYERMLLILVPLDRDNILWAVPGEAVSQNALSIAIGSSRDESWRVFDLGSALETYFRQHGSFPHVSLANARLTCCHTSKIEEQAHRIMSELFAGVGWNLQKAFGDLAAVDSELTSLDEPGRKWRVQEKSSNFNQSRGSYSISLWRNGGALGRRAYNDTDFDLLLAAVLCEEQLLGMFVFPVRVLAQRGLVGQKPSNYALRPPWAPGTRQATRTKCAWQLEFFLDLRAWSGELPLPPCVHTHLEGLVQKLRSDSS